MRLGQRKRSAATLSERQAAEVIRPNFDRYFYLSSYPDVARSDIDALDHFVRFGWREDRRPRADFDPVHYRTVNTDIPTDLNPFLHYILFGMAEGRVVAAPVVETEKSDTGEISLRNAVAGLSAEFAEVKLAASRVALLGADVASLSAELAEVKLAASRAAPLAADVVGLRAELAEVRSATKEVRDWRMNAALEAREQVRMDLLLAALFERNANPARTGSLVSIIMPTRKRSWLIDRAIQSVIDQVYESWELIIVADGCIDGLDNVVKKRQDKRIRLESLYEHAGAAAARNRGLSCARGEIIAYLDDDNRWCSDYLAQLVATYLAQPKLECAYGVLLIDIPGQHYVLWNSFDHSALRRGNYIDLNVFSHRKTVSDRLGGFDENLVRLQDWDLILKLTYDTTVAALPILAATYHGDAPTRITTVQPLAHAQHTIRSKWARPPASYQSVRVLYALAHYPQLSEQYIEAEIRFMRQRGVDIEVWGKFYTATSYASDLTIHRGTLQDAIDRFKPDIIHTHWLNSAAEFGGLLAERGIAMTARAHGFEVSHNTVAATLALPVFKKIFLYEHQANGFDLTDPRIGVIQNSFDTSMFAPAKIKDRKLVVRASAALGSKELGFFLEVAKLLPEHKFVLGAIACSYAEGYVGQLLEMRSKLDSPAEIRINCPHEEMADLIGRAGIYLHTAIPPGQPGATPIGQPVSIAEAMATGCYVLTRDLAPFRAYVAGAGAGYRDLDDAARLIDATTQWTEADWSSAYTRSVDRAWSKFDPSVSIAPIYDTWMQLLGTAN